MNENLKVDEKKKNTNKININIKNKKIEEFEVTDFYREKIMKLHIIAMIIMIVLFIFAFSVNMSQYKSREFVVTPTSNPSSLASQIKESAAIDGVVIFAGITPYCYIPAIGAIQSIQMVNDMVVRYALGISFIPTLILGGLIQIIGYSLCVAVGLYYCRLSSKKRKYYNQSSFTIADIRKSIYSIRKDEKKVEAIEKEQKNKAEKIEEYNIKIPYKNFIILGVLAFVIELVGIIITKI